MANTLVRAQCTGTVHLLSDTVEILGSCSLDLNLTLLSKEWLGGGDCVVFPAHIEEPDGPSDFRGVILLRFDKHAKR